MVPTTPEKPSILDRFSNYTRLKRVTAWIFHYAHNCGCHPSNRTLTDILTTEELGPAEWCWILKVQPEEFQEAMTNLKNGKHLPITNKLLAFHTMLDQDEILLLGRRIDKTKLPFQNDTRSYCLEVADLLN